MNQHRSSLASISNGATPPQMTVIGQVARKSGQYSQKKISADLAHLEEFDESLSRSFGGRQSPQTNAYHYQDRWAVKDSSPMLVDSRFRLSKGTLKTYDDITVNSSQLMPGILNLSKIDVPQVHQSQFPDHHKENQLQQSQEEQQVTTMNRAVSPMDNNSSEWPLAEPEGNSPKLSHQNSQAKQKKGIGAVTLKIQAFEIEELDSFSGTAVITGHRNTAKNRFRSEMTTRLTIGQPIANKLATGHSMRLNTQQQHFLPSHRQYKNSSKVAGGVLQDQTTMGSIIWDRGAISVTDAPTESINGQQQRHNAFPSIKRQSDFSTSSKREIAAFNTSALGIQKVMDGLKPVHNLGQSSMSVLGSQNNSSLQAKQILTETPGGIVAQFNRGRQRFRHKEFQPARVDIGLRGQMPFDNVLLMKSDFNGKSPQGKRKSMFVVEQAKRRTNNSELGFHKTVMSVATTNTHSQMHARIKSDIANDDSLTAVSTNHPATLLKGLNPRIAPKNRGSEEARKKVQNLLKHNQKEQQRVEIQVSPNQTVDSSIACLNEKSQIRCDCNNLLHTEMCETESLLLQAQKVSLTPYEKIILETPLEGGMETAMLSSTGNNDEHIEVKGEANIRLESQGCFDRTSSVMCGRMTPGTQNSRATSSKKSSKQVSKTPIPGLLNTSGMTRKTKMGSRQRQNVKDAAVLSGSTSLIVVEEKKVDSSTVRTRRVSAASNKKQKMNELDILQLQQKGGKMVLENMNTDTHRLLLKNESLGSGAGAESSYHFTPDLASCNAGVNPAESQVVKDYRHLSEEGQKQKLENDTSCKLATHRHSSQEEITIKMGRSIANVTNSFNMIANMSSQESIDNNAEAQEDHVKSAESVKNSIQMKKSSLTFQNHCLVTYQGNPKGGKPILNSNSVEARSQQQSPFVKRASLPLNPITDVSLYSSSQEKDCPVLTQKQIDQQQQEQKLQIKQIMREVQQQQQRQQPQSMFTTKTFKMNQFAVQTLNSTKSKPFSQRQNRHTTTRFMTNPEGATMRIGSLEAALESRKLRETGFKDPMLYMMSGIHQYTENQQAKSTLYGFKTRKSSCQPQQDGKSGNRLLLKAELDSSINDPLCSSTYHISKVPQILTQNLQAQTERRDQLQRTPLDQAKHNHQRQPRPRKQQLVVTIDEKNFKQQLPAKSPDRMQPYSPLKKKATAYSPKKIIGLTTDNYGTKEQSQAGDSKSPTGIQRIMFNNQDLHDIDTILVNSSEKQKIQTKQSLQHVLAVTNHTFGKQTISKNPFSGEIKKQQSAGIRGETPSGGRSPGCTYQEMINGKNGATSVVISKMNKQSPGQVTQRSIGHRPPLTSEQPDRQNDSQKLCTLSQSALRPTPSRRTGKAESRRGGDEQPQQNSQVQMIVLELPNLKADETKVSPPRVQVLSKEIEQFKYIQTVENSRNERDQATGEYKQTLDMNSVEQSEICSEVELIRRLPATMRNSHTIVLNSSKSLEKAEAEAYIEGRTGARMNSNSGSLNHHAIEELKTEQELANEKMIHPYIPGHFNPKKSPRDLIKNLLVLQQQAKEQNKISEGFCLQPGPAPIHDDLPVLQKIAYFDHLKQRDAHLKMLNSKIQSMKKNDAKVRLMRRKQENKQHAKSKSKRNQVEATPKHSQNREELQAEQENHKLCNIESLKMYDLQSENKISGSKHDSQPSLAINLNSSANMILQNEEQKNKDQGRMIVPISKHHKSKEPPISIPDIVQMGLNKYDGNRLRNKWKNEIAQVSYTAAVTPKSIKLSEEKLKQKQKQIYRDVSERKLPKQENDPPFKQQARFFPLRQSQLENSDLEQRGHKQSQVKECRGFVSSLKRKSIPANQASPHKALDTVVGKEDAMTNPLEIRNTAPAQVAHNKNSN